MSVGWRSMLERWMFVERMRICRKKWLLVNSFFKETSNCWRDYWEERIFGG